MELENHTDRVSFRQSFLNFQLAFTSQDLTFVSTKSTCVLLLAVEFLMSAWTKRARVTAMDGV